MGVELTIDWIGRSAADYARIFHAAANVNDFKEPLTEIAREVISPSVASNFASGGRPTWAALSPVTVERKSAAGVPNPSRVLVHSGMMMRRSDNYSEYKITRSELRAAPFATPYWKYHQTGTPRMPQRTIMMLQMADRAAITRIFANFLRGFITFDPRVAGARQFTGGGIGLGS